MTKTIWKYPLSFDVGVNVLWLPIGAHVLYVGAQNDTIMLWALVDSSASLVDRHFMIYGTGHEVAEGWDHYLGTTQTHEGRLVWHVFEREEAVQT